MSLPVRPYPEQGESLPGYLLRIAESNVSMAIYFDPLLANKIDPPMYV